MGAWNISCGETITIARNVGFQLPVIFKMPASTTPGPQSVSPASLTGYGLALIIGTVPGLNAVNAGEFGDPVFVDTNPVVTEPGLAIFEMGYLDTADLVLGTQYQYVILFQAPGENPTLCQYGDVRLIDAPMMPGFSPVN